MYKVVLADDETIALEGLRTLTDWGSWALRYAAPVRTGRKRWLPLSAARPIL